MKQRDCMYLKLSQYFVWLLGAALLVFSVFVPKLVPWFVELRRDQLRGYEALLFATVYASVLPAAYALYCMHRLLKNIGRDTVFVPINVVLLRRLTACCALEVVICGLSALYYPGFWMAAVAAVLMALLLRVVAAVFQQAVALKEENDLTV